MLRAAIGTVEGLQPMELRGRVHAVRGEIVEVRGLPAPVGSLIALQSDAGDREAEGEVVGFDGDRALVMALTALGGVRPGQRAVARQTLPTVGVGDALLGRCVDGLGRPVDFLGPIRGLAPRALTPPPVASLKRRRISEPLHTGVRAIDLMTTLGRGQRLGVFAGPGVGKSTLLGSIARNATSEVNVVALIGERGREVRDFVEKSLGPEGLRRSVVVIATGDESPLLRIRAALVACSIAEHFRDQGRQVLLMMDSITRLAHAQRQVGLSVAEPPATRGYTPSVFSLLARVLERAGAVEGSAGGTGGSVTGLYTVLVEGDEVTEPISDAVRGILDGHIILSRKLAQRGHYPAIDVLDSVSRVADDVSDSAHAAARRQVARLMGVFRQVEDLVQIGAYAKGSSVESDVAIKYSPAITEILRQPPTEHEPFDRARARLVQLAVAAGAELQPAPGRKA